MASHQDLAERMSRARDGLRQAGFDALLVTPGADLRYLTGYHALPLERLTCLVLPAKGGPCLVVPALEEPAARARKSPTGSSRRATRSWWTSAAPPRSATARTRPAPTALGTRPTTSGTTTPCSCRRPAVPAGMPARG